VGDVDETATRRAPSVAGVAGGVGTTTIARALAGSDRGVFTGRPVNVLVCRATADSLLRAARAAFLISAQHHRRPVLAVNTVNTAGPSRPSVARMRLLEPHTSGVVVLPYVRRWRDLATPLQDVTGLLGRPVTELPRPLRRFATAVHALAQVLGHPTGSTSPHRSSAPRRPAASPAHNHPPRSPQ
jgi:hypothetical protein